MQVDGELGRSQCVKTANSWRAKRLHRPLLVFTNGVESYVVIVAGPKITGETKILHVSDRLYITDIDVIKSMNNPGDEDTLRKAYDNTFLPYEKVRDEFFEGYRGLYQEIEKAVKGVLPQYGSAYAQRFLGRLMFLYFLQKKGWLKKDKKFVDSVHDYLELNKVFYESLNRKGSTEFPFLNGSLFEKEDYIDIVESKLSQKMDELFKKARKFFNRYNFTVDETAPLEVEVSIDPALIGTVFENMLPEYERGSKGTFYTPVTESSFICRRALANYFGLEDRVSSDGKKFIDGLNDYIGKLNMFEVSEFKNKLLSMKIMDPAVGSGGFLLVMMQEMLNLLKEVDTKAGWNYDPLEYKERIIRNLYGFDIEGEAIEIARLRLWLSLIIDQKTPSPLPNLDATLVQVSDSLVYKVNDTIDENVKDLERERELWRNEYIKSSGVEKNELKKNLDKIGKKINKLTGIDPNTIESYTQSKVDIVVMNPPYVRQESIDKKKKEFYVKRYGLDRKSDLYAYFIIRALKLVADNGVVSIISSDKWLETGYGKTLQEKIKENIVAIYGQRERSFGADVNTVITVMRKQNTTPGIKFVYLKSYGEDGVIQFIELDKRALVNGKWFYMKPGAKFFMEKIYPKLTHKLRDFADIKRGFTTGANEFFYMKDVSTQYEADYLSNPKRFEEWGVKAKNEKELEDQGLIYIENEGGERFVIEYNDVEPLIKGPKEISSYRQDNLIINYLCLYTDNPGLNTRKYVKYGESLGYNKLPSVRGRKNWYSISMQKKTRFVIIVNQMDRLFNPIYDKEVLFDKMFYLVYPKNISYETIFRFFNSTLFLMLLEIYGLRMGGGILTNTVEGYLNMPMPDLKVLSSLSLSHEKIFNRKAEPYYNEVKMEDRRELDTKVLEAIGINNLSLDEFYKEFVELVEDRLIKADRPLRNANEEKSPEGERAQ
ncbi:MAG: N-6 DNA methylase [Conexivisphaerales archaeon]